MKKLALVWISLKVEGIEAVAARYVEVTAEVHLICLVGHQFSVQRLLMSEAHRPW